MRNPGKEIVGIDIVPYCTADVCKASAATVGCEEHSTVRLRSCSVQSSLDSQSTSTTDIVTNGVSVADSFPFLHGQNF